MIEERQKLLKLGLVAGSEHAVWSPNDSYEAARVLTELLKLRTDLEKGKK